LSKKISKKTTSKYNSDAVSTFVRMYFPADLSVTKRFYRTIKKLFGRNFCRLATLPEARAGAGIHVEEMKTAVGSWLGSATNQQTAGSIAVVVQLTCFHCPVVPGVINNELISYWKTTGICFTMALFSGFPKKTDKSSSAPDPALFSVAFKMQYKLFRIFVAYF
jgi:hypothetical protein